MPAQGRVLTALVCREPFRLFFPLAILCGIIGVGHWLIYAAGWSHAYSGFFHASIQIQAYLICFVIGFLLTALPRFTATPPASWAEVGGCCALLVAQVVALWRGQWIAAESCFALLLAALALFAARRFAGRRTEVQPPTEFVWIPIAIAHGWLGALALIIGQRWPARAWLIGVGRPMLQQGFLLAIILGVGGFLAPRLMGRDVTPAPLAGTVAEPLARWRRRRVRVHLLAAAVLFASWWCEGAGRTALAYGLRAAVVTGELWWTVQLPRRPRVPDLYILLFWISLWMIVIGLWACAIWPRRRVELLHLVFLGGFSVMTFAIGTMVTLSHAGEAARLRDPLGILWLVGGGLIAALVFRIGAAFFPEEYFRLLGIAAGCWLIVSVSWLWCMLPLLGRVPPAAAFERMHEDAKQRLRSR